MTAIKPYNEDRRFRAVNEACAADVRASPARLSDARDGVVVFMGKITVCLPVAAALSLATQIADAIERHGERP